MNTEGNVTPLPQVGTDSWSAGSSKAEAPKQPKGPATSSKRLAVGVALLAASAGLAFGTFRIGVAQGDAAGHDRGLAEGYDSGHEAGFTQGRTEGYSSGREVGYDDGKADGYTSGYSSGKKAGYADGYKDGASGGYGQGWTDGCLAVFTALGDDTAAAWSDVDGMFDSTFVSTVDRFACY
jgi:hypothetical protein